MYFIKDDDSPFVKEQPLLPVLMKPTQSPIKEKLVNEREIFCYLFWAQSSHILSAGSSRVGENR